MVGLFRGHYSGFTNAVDHPSRDSNGASAQRWLATRRFVVAPSQSRLGFGNLRVYTICENALSLLQVLTKKL